MIVNPCRSGPNKGSATQYFIGDFNGHEFKPINSKTRWLDYGPDEYAGVTWSNTGNRKIFLGWMSNWLYANVVPTKSWRNAMTIPRELKIMHTGEDILVASEPVKELDAIQNSPLNFKELTIKEMDLTSQMKGNPIPARIDMSIENRSGFEFIISNDRKEELRVGLDVSRNQYYIDRTRSGKTEFQNDFSGRAYAPRFSKSSSCKLTLIIDVSSIELFADDGSTILTEIFFPTEPFNKMKLISSEKMRVKKLSVKQLRTIWK